MFGTEGGRVIRAFLALLFSTVPLFAEPLDTAQKFEDYVSGKTMFFHLGDGRVHAAETYLNNRKVRWSLVKDECLEGEWWAQDGKICFAYETNPDPQCWSVDVTPSGLTATSDAPVNPLVIFEVVGHVGEQTCLGPKVGV